MTNNTTLRVCLGIVVIGVLYGVIRLIQASLAPPDVLAPSWTVHDLPMQLGPWHGEATKLDPKIAAATGASDIEDRLFHNDAGNTVSLHSAMFSDPTQGMQHLPRNCYRAAGWKLREQTEEKIRVSDDRTVVVKLLVMEKDADMAVVAYWYQLGQRVLYDRVDLGEARWALRGVPKWPVMFKTMIHTIANDAKEGKAALLSFLEQYVSWFEKPQHQKYFERWPKS
ncbi:MAG: EpsI family protein [Planctomycetaceae bacterium]|nr:EpsI family protein [Planctomycetaceae bacterium]